MKRLKFTRLRIRSMRLILSNRVITVCLFFLVATLVFLGPVAAQVGQTISVSTSKPEYAVGDQVTILWDKNGPCVNMAGSGGYVSLYGPGMPGQKINLDQNAVMSGSYTPSLKFTSSSIGTWFVTVGTYASNCQASGSASWKVVAAVPEFSSLALVTFAVFLTCAVVIKRRRD